MRVHAFFTKTSFDNPEPNVSSGSVGGGVLGKPEGQLNTSQGVGDRPFFFWCFLVRIPEQRHLPLNSASSRTSTDLFIMFGSDLVRPGLLPKANYNIGPGHITVPWYTAASIGYTRSW